MRDRDREDDEAFQNNPGRRAERRDRRDDDDRAPSRPRRDDYDDEPPSRRRKHDAGPGPDLSDVPTHADTAMPREADFFVPPPPEIGPLSSAFSGLTRDTQPMETGPRAAVVLISAAVGIAIGVAINIFAQIKEPFWMLPWPVILGGIAALIAYFCTGFEYTCTYVGRDGVARFTCSGRRDYLSTDEVFLFRDAFELRTSQTRRYYRGVYQGTDYTYTWSDIGGRDVYTISGTHGSEEGNPAPEDFYHFALAAELAWSLSLLEEVDRQMMTKGEFRFSLGDGDWVSVGPEGLRLKIGGELTECSRHEIADVILQNGYFTIKRTDAVEGWFYSTGVFTFDYSRLANARLFVVALDKYAGLRLN